MTKISLLLIWFTKNKQGVYNNIDGVLVYEYFFMLRA